MQKPYLIQRASFEDRSHKSGIDSILSFDYMGSSEFEWGALPKSLNRIRDHKADYVYLTFMIKDKSITVYCKSSDVSEVDAYLNTLVENKIHLKEWSGFDKYIKGGDYFSDRFQFWWDIDNDIMWWKTDEKFEKRFKELI